MVLGGCKKTMNWNVSIKRFGRIETMSTSGYSDSYARELVRQKERLKGLIQKKKLNLKDFYFSDKGWCSVIGGSHKTFNSVSKSDIQMILKELREEKGVDISNGD